MCGGCSSGPAGCAAGAVQHWLDVRRDVRQALLESDTVGCVRRHCHTQKHTGSREDEDTWQHKQRTLSPGWNSQEPGNSPSVSKKMHQFPVLSPQEPGISCLRRDLQEQGVRRCSSTREWGPQGNACVFGFNVFWIHGDVTPNLLPSSTSRGSHFKKFGQKEEQGRGAAARLAQHVWPRHTILHHHQGVC